MENQKTSFNSSFKSFLPRKPLEHALLIHTDSGHCQGRCRENKTLNDSCICMYVFVWCMYNANWIRIGPELWNAKHLNLHSLFIIHYAHLGTISWLATAVAITVKYCQPSKAESAASASLPRCVANWHITNLIISESKCNTSDY